MTLILVIFILASIASMAWAFLSSIRFEAAATALEERIKSRLDQPPPATTESDKGTPK